MCGNREIRVTTSLGLLCLYRFRVTGLTKFLDRVSASGKNLRCGYSFWNQGTGIPFHPVSTNKDRYIVPISSLFRHEAKVSQVRFCLFLVAILMLMLGSSAFAQDTRTVTEP